MDAGKEVRYTRRFDILLQEEARGNNLQAENPSKHTSRMVYICESTLKFNSTDIVKDILWIWVWYLIVVTYCDPGVSYRHGRAYSQYTFALLQANSEPLALRISTLSQSWKYMHCDGKEAYSCRRQWSQEMEHRNHERRSYCSCTATQWCPLVKPDRGPTGNRPAFFWVRIESGSNFYHVNRSRIKFGLQFFKANRIPDHQSYIIDRVNLNVDRVVFS